MICTSSKAIKSLDVTNALACLQAKSFRCLWTFRYPFARRLLAFLRFFPRLTFRETRRCKRLSFFSALLRRARILNLLAVRIGVEGFQPNINASLLTCGFMDHLPLGMNSNLTIVAIGAFHQANALDLRQGERGKRTRFCAPGVCANQAYRPDAMPIGERDALPVAFQTPAGRLILNASIVSSRKRG